MATRAPGWGKWPVCGNVSWQPRTLTHTPGLGSPEPAPRVGAAAGSGPAPARLAPGTVSWLTAAGVKPEGSRPTWSLYLPGDEEA